MAGQVMRGSGMDFESAAFMASLRAAVARIEVRAEAQLWVLGLRVQNNARLLAPVNTGRLRASIMATKGKDANGAFVDISTNVSYAIYVEFGTRYQAAQPFMRPALAAAAGYGSMVMAGGV